MSTKMMSILGLSACLLSAPAAMSVDLGTITLQPDMAGQIVSILVTGGDQAAGANLCLQIGGGTSGPVITAVNLVSGTIWSPSTPIANDLGDGDSRTVYWSVVTGSGTVGASGTLAQLTIDTTGLDSGSFPIVLDPSGSPTQVIDAAGDPLPGVFANGTVMIATVTPPGPGPGSVGTAEGGGGSGGGNGCGLGSGLIILLGSVAFGLGRRRPG